MRILIVSSLKRKITPETTASRTRIIYELVNGLLKRNHEITILGTGDSSVPGAKIIPVIPQGFIDMPPFENPFYAETSYLVKLAKKIEETASSFDIVHNHTYPEFINLLVAGKIKTPIVTTLHAQATPEFDNVLNLFPNTYLVSISNAHRKLFTKAKIYKTIYNGVDTDLYGYCEKKEDYLLWLGRLSKAKNKDGSFFDSKGIKWAIKLAQETDNRLFLSGNVEDMTFFNKDVKPHLNDKIKWIGPVSSEQMLTKEQVVKLMQKARAYLMTINWYEPFGLVMAEVMSCGTPVIGFDRGSVSELVIDGKTGFVVPPENGLAGLKKVLAEIDKIDPKNCREHIINNFSIEKMITNYENLYNEIVDK